MIHSVRTKLLIWFLSFTLINVLIITISFIYINEKEGIEKLNSNIQSLEVLLYKDANTISNFYLNEIENPIFHFTKSSYNIEEHNVYISAINIKIQSILNSEAINIFPLQKSINYLSELVDTTNEYFKNIVKLILLKGYDNNGLISERITCLNKIKNQLKYTHNEKLDFIELEYQLKSNNRITLSAVKQIVKNFKNIIISNPSINKNRKIIIFTQLNKYLELSAQIDDLNKQLGIENDSGLKKKIENNYSEIAELITKISKEVSEKKSSIFIIYRNLYIISTFIILLIGFLLSFYSSKRSSKNIINLSNNIKKYINSKFTNNDNLTFKGNKDEVSLLIDSFNILKTEIRNHIDNLESIVKERTFDLETTNEELKSANEELFHQREEVVSQKELIEKQNIKVLNSIKYAKRIQDAIMHETKHLNTIFPESFVLSRTKSLVGGDFFWFKNYKTKTKNLSFISVSDCTGHGVPGAFMSLLGITYLNEILSNERITKANQVLEKLREKIILTLQQSRNDIHDGMDLAFCIYNHDTKILQYSGAYRPLFIIRNKQLIEIKADKIPIGKAYKTNQNYKNHEIEIIAGDTIYLFTDGYLDQFGNNNLKFNKSRFVNLLVEICNKPMQAQKTILDSEMDKWMGSKDQTDDIMIMGLKT